MRHAMIRLVPILLALGFSLPVQALGDLDVLPQGRYGCWTPGVATGPAVNDEPGRSFTIVRGSSYETAAGGGVYLLADDVLTFTRGPLKDLRLRRNRGGFWQQIERNGDLAPLKCSRRGSAAPA